MADRPAFACVLDGCTRKRHSASWCKSVAVCTIDDCSAKAHSRGWCSRHYGSWRRTGDPLTSRRHRSRTEPAPPCAVDGCDAPKRKFEWCTRHAALARSNGDPTKAKYEWSAKVPGCIACGSAVPDGRRQYCSAACHQASYRSDWRTRACLMCGNALDISRKDGKYLPGYKSSVCETCRRPRSRARDYAVVLLAHFLGNGCGICGEPVDLAIRFPDPRCASVDHIVPRVLGGTDDATNLQLAHFGCNCEKTALKNPPRMEAV